MKNNVSCRESNMDLLRIIATIAVIGIHVNATYYDAITNPNTFGEVYTNHILTLTMYDTLTRFAVPCFVMLSGAFILANDKNAEYIYFYKKTFRNVWVHTVVFTGIYFVYSYYQKSRYTAFYGLIHGEPFGHMWYLSMLFWLYVLAPIVIMFKKSISEHTFTYVAAGFMIVAAICANHSTFEYYWDIGFSFYYLGYFMMGYVLRNYALKHKKNAIGMGLIGIGIMLMIAIAYIRYCNTIGKLWGELNESLIGAMDFPMLLAAVLIFAGFAHLNIKWKMGNLATYCFFIYLIHGGIEDYFCKRIIKFYGVTGDCTIIVPLEIVMTFLVSLMLAIVYKKNYDLLSVRCICYIKKLKKVNEQKKN